MPVRKLLKYVCNFEEGAWSYSPLLFFFVIAGIGGIVLATKGVINGNVPIERGLFILLLAHTNLLIMTYLYAKYRERKHVSEIIQLKDQFVYIATHELKIPASAIKWIVNELLKTKSAFIGSEKLLYNLLQSSDRLMMLINDLLNVSRIESSGVVFNIQSVSIKDAAVESVNRVAELSAKEKIAVKNNVPDNLKNVLADRERLIEVLDNLLSNGIKYNKEGGEIVIGAEEKEGFMEVNISDTGIGIKSENQKNIYEKFWRERNKNIEGTGLGLFIVKRIVEQMGGKVWFKSEPDKGSTFYFTVPKIKADKV